MLSVSHLSRPSPKDEGSERPNAHSVNNTEKRLSRCPLSPAKILLTTPTSRAWDSRSDIHDYSMSSFVDSQPWWLPESLRTGTIDTLTAILHQTVPVRFWFSARTFILPLPFQTLRLPSNDYVSESYGSSEKVRSSCSLRYSQSIFMVMSRALITVYIVSFDI